LPTAARVAFPRVSKPAPARCWKACGGPPTPRFPVTWQALWKILRVSVH